MMTLRPACTSLSDARAATAAAVTCLLVTGILVLSAGQPSSADPAEPPAAAAAASGKLFSSYFRKLTRERRAISALPRRSAPPGPVEQLSPEDVFIAVKSTGRFHRQRLELLLDTWISRNVQQTYVFTDGEDERLRRRMGSHLINTNCSFAHTRQALSCKMSAEYDAFINSERRWFCHVDDDNYVNSAALLKLLSQFSHTQDVYLGRPSLEHPLEVTQSLERPLEVTQSTETKQVRFWFATGGAGFCLSRGLALKMKPWASEGKFVTTAERIRLPDDCTVGFIAEVLLGVKLSRSPLFHSHLENLDQVSEIHNQVTLSYGGVGSRNRLTLERPFTSSEDPTRFRSLHCLLYPDTPWCPSSWRLDRPSRDTGSPGGG